MHPFFRRPFFLYLVPAVLGMASSYYQFLPLIRKRQKEAAEKKRLEQEGALVDGGETNEVEAKSLAQNDNAVADNLTQQQRESM